jgi:hypothetical protein
MSPHRAWGHHPPEGQGDDWHWLWEAYVAGMCVAAAAAVVMLDHRFPGNVPVAVTALAGIVVCWRSAAASSVRMNSVGEPRCFSRR